MRFLIDLPQESYDNLRSAARTDRRHLRDQAAILLIQALSGQTVVASRPTGDPYPPITGSPGQPCKFVGVRQ